MEELAGDRSLDDVDCFGPNPNKPKVSTVIELGVLISRIFSHFRVLESKVPLKNAGDEICMGKQVSQVDVGFNRLSADTSSEGRERRQKEEQINSLPYDQRH